MRRFIIDTLSKESQGGQIKQDMDRACSMRERDKGCIKYLSHKIEKREIT
jgi:hypothetical protein